METESRAPREFDPVLAWLETSAGGVPDTPHSAWFTIDRVPLRIRTNEAAGLAWLRRELGLYETDPPREGPEAPLRVSLYAVVSPEPSPFEFDEKPGRSIDGDPFLHRDWGGRRSFSREGELLVSFGRDPRDPVRILSILKRGSESSTARAVRLPVLRNWKETGEVVQVLAARADGSTCLHAGAVAREDRAVLILGASGAGKTTTSLSLLRAGLTLLSDEVVLLRRRMSGAFEVSGILMPPRIVGRSLTDLADLESTLGAEGPAPKGHLSLPAASLSRGLGMWAAPVALVVLRRGDPRRDHRLARTSPHDVLPDVMSSVLDPTSALAPEGPAVAALDLASSLPSYALTLGSDLGSLPALFCSLFEEA